MSSEIIESQQTTYTIDWFSVINDLWHISSSFLTTLSWSFHKSWPYAEALQNWIDFAWKRFYNYWEDVLMFEYSSLEGLNQDKTSWEKIFKKKNAITSETINWKQPLESSWFFEFNWKYYLLWLLYQDIDKDDNNEEEWVYKGVIINPSRYFRTEDAGNHFSQKVNWLLI